MTFDAARQKLLDRFDALCAQIRTVASQEDFFNVDCWPCLNPRNELIDVLNAIVDLNQLARQVG